MKRASNVRPIVEFQFKHMLITVRKDTGKIIGVSNNSDRRHISIGLKNLLISDLNEIYKRYNSIISSNNALIDKSIDVVIDQVHKSSPSYKKERKIYPVCKNELDLFTILKLDNLLSTFKSQSRTKAIIQINSLLFLIKNKAGWKILQNPKAIQSTRYYFSSFVKQGVWQDILNILTQDCPLGYEDLIFAKFYFQDVPKAIRTKDVLNLVNRSFEPFKYPKNTLGYHHQYAKHLFSYSEPICKFLVDLMVSLGDEYEVPQPEHQVILFLQTLIS